jgi:thiamine-monophosphate kinase
MAGEFSFIDWLKKQTTSDPRVVVPLGDDLAAVTWEASDLLIVGVDQVLDGVHFDSSNHSPEAIGRKVMNRNLSDCAAMACLPAYAVATVALPHGSGAEYAQQLFIGLRDAGARFDCSIVGGDTASWPGKLVVTVTILGRSAGVKPVTRAGAQAGDGIYVTGPLGGSILGRHMTFKPRVNEARLLAQSVHLTSMIDVSDGLSRDLCHICRMSGMGAQIDASEIPIHADAFELSKQDDVSALDHALHDGEDHELIFTTPETPPIGKRIGTITAGTDILLCHADRNELLKPKGWEHRL